MKAGGAGAGRLVYTPEAAALCCSKAKGRALVLAFRELSPAGCCSAGAMVGLEWRPVETVRKDPDLVCAGDIGGVPLFYHFILKAFMHENEMRIVRRRFGPWAWLALESDADPAMWCYFGKQPFDATDPAAADTRPN